MVISEKKIAQFTGKTQNGYLLLVNPRTEKKLDILNLTSDMDGIQDSVLTNDAVLVFLVLTLNKFYTFF